MLAKTMDIATPPIFLFRKKERKAEDWGVGTLHSRHLSCEREGSFNVASLYGWSVFFWSKRELRCTNHPSVCTAVTAYGGLLVGYLWATFPILSALYPFFSFYIHLFNLHLNFK